MGLEAFLDNKPLYYDEIDYTRIPRIFAKVSRHFKTPKIIHIVGTNGKGSTGRYLANALYRMGFRVGHYTSPHIITFNERIWRDGAPVSNEVLEAAHLWVLEHLERADANALSYFEYTTLLAMRVYDGCEYVVLEAGLGGEHDATNVFNKVLSVFTPIAMDHEAFLGDTIDAIAATKMRSMQDLALCATQPYNESSVVFDALCKARDTTGYCVAGLLEADEAEALQAIVVKRHLPAYMYDNIATAFTALKLLGLPPNTRDFDDNPLFGRMTQLRANVYLDVGHNPLAAKAIVSHFKDRKIRLVYNSYADKDYTTILTLLKPVLECVEIIPIDSIRAEETVQLRSVLGELGITCKDHVTCNADATYLVFGSFSVAEAFLKRHDFKRSNDA